MTTFYAQTITGSHEAPKFVMPVWSNLDQRG